MLSGSSGSVNDRTSLGFRTSSTHTLRSYEAEASRLASIGCHRTHCTLLPWCRRIAKVCWVSRSHRRMVLSAEPDANRLLDHDPRREH